MTRGNQRDLARERNAKNQPAGKQSETAANAGLSLEERKERDAQRMREKQKAKDEAKANASQAADTKGKK